jgi:hypothetical protein
MTTPRRRRRSASTTGMEIELAEIAKDISNIKDDIHEIKDAQSNKLVTHDQLQPFKDKVNFMFKVMFVLLGVMFAGLAAAFFQKVFGQ